MTIAPEAAEDLWSWRASRDSDVSELARRWLASSALARLMATLGGPTPSASAPAALRAWTAAHLDTRRGAERRDAPAVTWKPEWNEALLNAAEPLGLIATAPPAQRAYDAVLVLGGATTGNRLRVALTAQLFRSGHTFGEIIGLSADRPLGEREVLSEPDALNDGSEWRNLLRYIEASFGPLTPLTAQAGSDHGDGSDSWRDEAYAERGGPTFRLLVAPDRPERRPTTADAIGFYLSRAAEHRHGSVLVVTSAIYAPYQFFAIAPQLLCGCRSVELVGTSTAQDGSPTLAQRLGQEIHAAVTTASARSDPGG